MGVHFRSCLAAHLGAANQRTSARPLQVALASWAWWLDTEKEKDTRGGGCKAYYNPALEVMQCHFYCILVVTLGQGRIKGISTWVQRGVVPGEHGLLGALFGDSLLYLLHSQGHFYLYNIINGVTYHLSINSKWKFTCLHEIKVTIKGNKIHDHLLLVKASAKAFSLGGGPLETSVLWEFLISILRQKGKWNLPAAKQS